MKFIGQKKDVPKQRGYAHKHAVLTLVERGKGARSFHVAGTSAADVMPILKANIAKETHIMTDEAGQYAGVRKHFAGHNLVRHGAEEYGRGMKGVYQHCAEKHLHRYVAEFDFRYSNRSCLGVENAQRAVMVIRGAMGKRLMCRRPD